MSIASLIQPVFEQEHADGPGCGSTTHSPDCVCDVDLSLVPAAGPTFLPMPALAREMLLGYTMTPQLLANYLGTVMAIREKAIDLIEGGVTIDELEEARSLFLDVWGSSHGDTTVKLPLLREALGVYRTAGLTFHATARHLRTDAGVRSQAGGVLGRAITIVDVVRILNRGDESPEHCEKLALIDTALREGVDTYAELVKITGLNDQQIGHFARRWGYKTLTHKRMTAGGGVKNSVETLDKLRELHAQGLKPKEILAAVHEAIPASRDTLTYSLVATMSSRINRRAVKTP